MTKCNNPSHDFDASPTLDELIEQQGKKPLQDPSVLLGDFWPEEEPIERFLDALHEWRGHRRPERAA